MSVFAMTGLIIFLTIFIGAVAWAIFGRAGYMDRMSRLPLDTTDNKQSEL